MEMISRGTWGQDFAPSTPAPRCSGHNLLTQPAPSPGFKPPPSNTPHFSGGIPQAPYFLTLVWGLSHLPLMSGTQRSQKALQHESPWRVVLSCLTACLGFEDEAPPGLAISPNTTASSSPAMGSTLRHLQFPKHRPVSTLPLITYPASIMASHLPPPYPSGPILLEKEKTPAPGMGI